MTQTENNSVNEINEIEQLKAKISELEKKINGAIREYYKFDDDFYAPFGSIASVDLLNGMKPKNIPDFYLILDKIKY